MIQSSNSVVWLYEIKALKFARSLGIGFKLVGPGYSSQ